MKSIVWLAALSLTLSACAIKRPLIAPRDIPAYEQKQRDKLKEREDFLREEQEREQQNQPQPAPAQPAPVVGS